MLFSHILWRTCVQVVTNTGRTIRASKVPVSLVTEVCFSSPFSPTSERTINFYSSLAHVRALTLELNHSEYYGVRQNALCFHHYPPHCLPQPYSLHTTKHNICISGGEMAQDVGMVRVKVLWCHSRLVWLVFEASIPTCACFPSENFLCDLLHTNRTWSYPCGLLPKNASSAAPCTGTIDKLINCCRNPTYIKTGLFVVGQLSMVSYAMVYQ